jgi:hypothetical protein
LHEINKIGSERHQPYNNPRAINRNTDYIDSSEIQYPAQCREGEGGGSVKNKNGGGGEGKGRQEEQPCIVHCIAFPQFQFNNIADGNPRYAQKFNINEYRTPKFGQIYSQK